MELDELRQMSAEDLRVKEREMREEIFRLRFKLRTNQLDNPSNYRSARGGTGADHDAADAKDRRAGAAGGKAS